MSAAKKGKTAVTAEPAVDVLTPESVSKRLSQATVEFFSASVGGVMPSRRTADDLVKYAAVLRKQAKDDLPGPVSGKSITDTISLSWKFKYARLNETEAMDIEMMKASPDWEVIKGCNERRKQDASTELAYYGQYLTMVKPTDYRGNVDDIMDAVKVAQQYGFAELRSSFRVYCHMVNEARKEE
jgi:hypothetical protein